MNSPATVIRAREQDRQEEAWGIVGPGEGARGEPKLGVGLVPPLSCCPSSATEDSHAHEDPAYFPGGCTDMSLCKA